MKKLIAEIDKKFDSTEFRNRVKVIEDDLGRYFQTTKYEILGTEGDIKNKPLPGMTFVSSNKAQTWANYCMNILSSADPVINITKRDSNLTPTDIALLKNFWDVVYTSANYEREENGELPINQHNSFESVMTDTDIMCGIVEHIDKKIRFKIQVAETTTACWAKGKNGIKWVAFRFLKTKDEIKDEYGIEIKEDEANETHWWGYKDDKVTQIIFIEKDVVPNGTIDWSASMEKIPIAISPVLLVPQVRIGTTLMTSGASIYWGQRDQLDELNRSKSIKATFLMREAVPALKHKSVAADGTPGSSLARYPKDGSVTDMLNKDEDILPVFINTPTGLAAADSYDRDNMAEVEQNSVPEIAYGGQEFAGMPTSLWDRRAFQMAKVLMPRRKAMEIAYKHLFNSMFEQFCKMNLEINAGGEKGYSDQKITSAELEKLKGKFSVKFLVTSVEPQGDMLKFQKAEIALQAGVDSDWVDEHILEYDDVKTVRENRIKRASLELRPEHNLFELYSVLCKEYDNMKNGRERKMLLQRLKLMEADLKMIAERAVSGGKDEPNSRPTR